MSGLAVSQNGIIKHIDGLGGITYDHIQAILKDGTREKMWTFTNIPHSRKEQAVVVKNVAAWVEKDD